HFQPLLAVPDQGAMVGSGVEIFGCAPVALHRTKLRIARIDRRAAQAEKLLQQPVHLVLAGRFDLQPQIGCVAVGASDAELLDFEAAVVFDHLVEDLLHDVRVDQMALRLDYFLEWHRSFHYMWRTYSCVPRRDYARPKPMRRYPGDRTPP